MKLEEIVPLGRTLSEYRAMFALVDDLLTGKILGCADGPASFNAEMGGLGYRVTSIDPIYAFSAAEIQARFEAVIDNIMDQVDGTREQWHWEFHESPAALRKMRETALARFVKDFESGAARDRYLPVSLPELPFASQAFDLALCSHFLFLYSDKLSEQFHLDAIQEMLRVAMEVRVFPLVDLEMRRSRHLPVVMRWAHDRGIDARVQRVEYQLQRGANEMLVLRKSAG